ncbi:aspartyl protease family protein At5g10770-like [Curcuma longa]|uniref:aspartyl protease family protein At5g10770-like n=1 Tax=Curcuma longa TaxID=136217 RepID=UPI003D9E5023
MTTSSPPFPSFVLLLLVLLALTVNANGETRSHHKVNISSLLPRKVCSNSKDVISDVTRLRLVHRHGPCSPAMRRRQSDFHAEILARDQLRVGFLRQRIAAAELGGGGGTSPASAGAAPSTKIPARSGESVSAGDYIVTVGLGTPPTAQTLFVDTGSDVTWVQCRPCAISCHRQLDQLFAPASSATYANVTCASAACADLDVSGCSGGTCLYGVAYGDGSQSVGFYSSDALALTPADVVPRFLFGCGQDNEGLFGRAAGILGLGGGRPSLVAQTMNKYNGVFGYCLPASASDAGYLAFGKSGITNPTVKYTNMLTDAKTPTFYFLNLTGISVSGQRLSILPAVFAKAGTLIDSGTVITRLPPAAYTSLRSAFRQGMSRYKNKRAPAVSILDTCYDPTGRGELKLPAVALQFAGDVSVNLAPEGIVYAVNRSRICLAFAANDGDGDVGILGNVQQRTFGVIYDVPKKVIGFAAGGC